MAIKISSERKLRFLKEYMDEYIRIWPNPMKKPFDSWLDSTLDKRASKWFNKHRTQQRQICRYCNRPFDDYISKTKDHVIPISKGGLDKKENRRPCCYDCNQWKDSKMPKQWLDELTLLARGKKEIRPPYDKHIVGRMIGNLKSVIEELKSNKKKVSTYNF